MRDLFSAGVAINAYRELSPINSVNKVETISSIELVKQINVFRSEEGNRSELEHRTLLRTIRDEFEEEINQHKIVPVTYKDKKGESRAMFSLTPDQAKQVLMRESKFVRKAMINYINNLEKAIKELIIPSYQIDDPIKRAERWIEEAKVTKTLSEKVESLKIELDESSEWYTVKRYSKEFGVVIDWQSLKKASVMLGVEIKKVFDANYGSINAYHISVYNMVANR